ncbi:recombinase family protein [Conexibacter arvalis]|uniref:DNA invertase Pin-like site-specific DNA recombinase n=1 Tax=Conexibacter arvalis TaxID=912552 RepID=A0A840IGT4_9ACTN|nr:recombinase family protein [Conexibacter arvalis]MBB4663160.1 DNA invertase Pin-like site-specific DNA recombinase [Conexibacter arvalis]
MAAARQRRALGVVRVSRVAGRDGRGARDDRGDRLLSPAEQRDRIERLCERERLDLLDLNVQPELNTSGGDPLSKREGLRTAIEAVEAGRAEVIVVAYFDRLVRSLRVQAEVLERIEAAGGRVLAADVGEISGETAAKWLSATMLGMVSEYVRRTTAERTRGAQRRAVEEGRPPFPLIPGLIRVKERVEIDHDLADVVREAVAMRARKETIASIRGHLRSQGIERSYHGVQSLISSRLLIGEVVFGDYRGSVPALIEDRALWEKAQRARVPRGRRPRSDRLLARLGVLRCGTCGARMVVGSANNRQYPLYRCPPVGDCTRRVTISAELVEGTVVDHVKLLLADLNGRASADQGMLAASARLDRTQEELDAAIRAFSALGDEPAAVARLAELRANRDAARDEYERMADTQAALTITVADWDDLTRDEQRDLISAVIETVTVQPGRGADRIAVHPRALAAS